MQTLHTLVKSILVKCANPAPTMHQLCTQKKELKKMEDKNKSGIFLPLLQILFIGLKLTGYINWSWLWVLAPSWTSLAIAIVIAILVLLYRLIKGCFEK